MLLEKPSMLQARRKSLCWSVQWARLWDVSADTLINIEIHDLVIFKETHEYTSCTFEKNCLVMSAKNDIHIVHAWPCKINTQHCNYPELFTESKYHSGSSMNNLVMCYLFHCELFTIYVTQNIPRNVWMRTPHSCITIFWNSCIYIVDYVTT